MGESDLAACGPSASFSFHLASSSFIPAGSVHKYSGDNVVCMWMQLKILCVCYRGGMVVMDVI